MSRCARLQSSQCSVPSGFTGYHFRTPLNSRRLKAICRRHFRHSLTTAHLLGHLRQETASELPSKPRPLTLKSVVSAERLHAPRYPCSSQPRSGSRERAELTDPSGDLAPFQHCVCVRGMGTSCTPSAVKRRQVMRHALKPSSAGGVLLPVVPPSTRKPRP